MEAREEELLLCLCHKARTLALPQISTAFFAGRTASARRSLKRLEASGFIRLGKRPAKLLPPGGPLWAGDPRRDDPADFEAIVRSCRHRFDGAELHFLAHATRKAENLVGGVAGDSAIAELSHDLHLGAVALTLTGGTFLREDLLEKRPGVMPDGIFQGPGRGTVIEIVGSSYPAARLLQLFNFAADADLLIRFY